MSARLLEGAAIAARLRDDAAAKAAAFREATGRAPKLAALMVGTARDAEAYLRRKAAACRDAGLEFDARHLPPSASESDAARELDRLSADAGVDAVAVERPLPPDWDAAALIDRLDPAKDVEGQTSTSMGRLYGARTIEAARRSFWPCTAEALLLLLDASGVEPRGLEAVVAGRSGVVGRPAAHLLTCRDATVTLCHSATRGLEELAARADIVVCATTRAGWLKSTKPGAVVLDAGTHYDGRRVVGDAAPSAAETAGFLTPVPGGVGPVTVAVLISHAVEAAERRLRR